ncbi:hypothetical protein [Vallitalea guaymasensis]|uniref:hypothetical protein n=1 Tax=Vallitalea guaymasensis TaxID=1185412 RepID=UPI002355A073|nr:hypothetical protein [Vallitalea guaymasensis]
MGNLGNYTGKVEIYISGRKKTHRINEFTLIIEEELNELNTCKYCNYKLIDKAFINI